ncbi:unnamed protein product [Prunus armeniaca]|uniref:Uncharacterized protein n=1 Tax=Prunus armeniaca TaxID=36596 RepID=A0A6J5TR68_PRUAR|nr:unnamed protein product [Prunus armeniaca]
MIPPSISHLTGFAQLENLTLRMFHGQSYETALREERREGSTWPQAGERKEEEMLLGKLVRGRRMLR